MSGPLHRHLQMLFRVKIKRPPTGLVLAKGKHETVVVEDFVKIAVLDRLHNSTGSLIKMQHLDRVRLGNTVVGYNNIMFENERAHAKLEAINHLAFPMTLIFSSSSPSAPTSAARANAAVIIQSYVRMVSSQHQVLFALYKQSELSLEQSLLNIMIHHEQSSPEPHNVHKANILQKHNSTANLRSVVAVQEAAHFSHAAEQCQPVDNIDNVIHMFQACVRAATDTDQDGALHPNALKHLFARADTDQDGAITRREMQVLFDDLDFCLSESETAALFHWIDFDEDGAVDLDEFIAAACGTTMTLGEQQLFYNEENKETAPAGAVLQSISGADLLFADQAKCTRRTRRAQERFLNACELGVVSLMKEVADDLMYNAEHHEVDICGIRAHDDGWTPMHCACMSGSLDAVEWLVDRGGAVDDEDRRRVRPVMIAARGGHVEICKLLFLEGADVYGRRDSLSCVEAAIMGKHEDVLCWLARVGVSV